MDGFLVKDLAYFKNFSTRRALAWFLCLFPANIILCTWYIIGDIWVWTVACPLIFILILGEWVRYRRVNRASTHG